MTDLKKIKQQSEFCKMMMEMLDAEIQDSKVGNYSGMNYFSGIENHTRKQGDIKRLRRELMKLANMLDPWKED